MLERKLKAKSILAAHCRACHLGRGGEVGFVTHYLEGVGLAVDDNLPYFGIDVILTSNKTNELYICGCSTKKRLEFWSVNARKREAWGER